MGTHKRDNYEGIYYPSSGIKYHDPAKLKEKIDEYFTNCPHKKTVTHGFKRETVSVPTISGLALYLGFADKKSLYDYEKNPRFTEVIKYARTRIENIYEMGLHSPNVIGSIFALKNFGWQDTQHIKQEVEETLYVDFSTMNEKEIDEEIIKLQKQNPHLIDVKEKVNE